MMDFFFFFFTEILVFDQIPIPTAHQVCLDTDILLEPVKDFFF